MEVSPIWKSAKDFHDVEEARCQCATFARRRKPMTTSNDSALPGSRLNGAISAAGAMAPNFITLAAMSMLGAFMMAGMNPAVHAASRDLTPRMGRAMVYAWVSLAFTVGALMSTLIAAQTLPIWPGWRPQYWIGSVLGVFTAIVLYLFYRDLSPRVRGQVLEKLADAEIDPKSSHSMLVQVVRTVRRCHEGQALDLSAAVDLLQPSEIRPTALAISRLKTGGLTALSSWLGATAAGANRITPKALGRFGMNVGVCLQMRNDLNELRRFLHGEQRFDDLRNARVTWPWAWAAKTMSSTEMVVLQHRLRHALGEVEELKSVARRLLDVVGDRGDLLIKMRLERELTLLGEHVESTQSMRSALSNLQGMR